MIAYGPTMRYSNETLDYVKCSKCPRLAIIHAIGTNHHHRSIASSMTVCLSIKRCLILSTFYTGCWQPMFSDKLNGEQKEKTFKKLFMSIVLLQ